MVGGVAVLKGGLCVSLLSVMDSLEREQRNCGRKSETELLKAAVVEANSHYSNDISVLQEETERYRKIVSIPLRN